MNFCSWEGNTSSTTGILTPGFPETATKGWYRKIIDLSILICIIIKMSLRDRLLSFKILIGMLLFCLPPPGCFLNVCLPTLLAAVLKFFFPLTTSATSGTANSNKSVPTRFAAGTVYFLKKEIVALPITCARAPKPALFDVQYLCSREVQECLVQPFYTLILTQKKVRNISYYENKST